MSEATQTFVPKAETEGAVELSLDEAMDLAVKLQDEAKAAKKVLDNVKAVVKAQMVARGVKEYETPNGHKAKWSERQNPKYDKEMIKEATGELFELCVTFSTVKQFKIS
jgi:hypothetical protein